MRILFTIFFSITTNVESPSGIQVSFNKFRTWLKSGFCSVSLSAGVNPGCLMNAKAGYLQDRSLGLLEEAGKHTLGKHPLAGKLCTQTWQFLQPRDKREREREMFFVTYIFKMKIFWHGCWLLKLTQLLHWLWTTAANLAGIRMICAAVLRL